MTTFRIFRYLCCLVALCATVSYADSIQLRSGRHLQGKFIGGTATSIEFMTNQAVEYFPTSDVLAVLFDSNDASLGRLQPNSKRIPSRTASPAAINRASERTSRHISSGTPAPAVSLTRTAYQARVPQLQRTAAAE